MHGRGYLLNLGLVRIKGSFTAEMCSDAISKKLSEFGLDFRTDIVGITTDGYAMMKKLGRIILPFQQLCYAHGLQLVIQSIFYRSKPKTQELITSTTDSDEEEVSLDIDEESKGLIVLNTPCQENSIELCDDINDTVKQFKRSPLKNEILQKYVRETHPNGLNLILDCKTRWSSLLEMLLRIIQLKLPVQKALLDLGASVYLSDHEFIKIEAIAKALIPIKIAVEALCRRDANLITAEATVKFLLNELSMSPSYYNNQILEAIDRRIIQERYIDASVVIQHLHNPQTQIEKKVTINRFCCDVFSRIRGNVDVEENLNETQSTTTSGNNSEYSDPENVSVQEKLQLAIDASLKNPKESSQNTLPLSTLLKYELTIAEQTGKRGKFLEEIYQMLYVISAEAERIFSSAAYLCNRFRSRLNDETIDALVFIKITSVFSNSIRVGNRIVILSRISISFYATFIIIIIILIH